MPAFLLGQKGPMDTNFIRGDNGLASGSRDLNQENIDRRRLQGLTSKDQTSLS